jgi:hypothetical protein
MSDDLSREEILESFALEQAEHRLVHLRDTLLLAEARSLSAKEVIEHLRAQPEREYRDALLYRLKELPLTEEDQQKFWEIFAGLSEAGDAPGTSKERPKIDRVLMHLSYALPDERRREVARMYLRHKRKTRRAIAYRALRDCGVDNWAAEALFEQMKLFEDEEPENLLARNAGSLNDEQIRKLLGVIKDGYWQMRVIASLIKHERRELLKELSHKLPDQFVRAVGWSAWSEDPPNSLVSYLPQMRELLPENRGRSFFLEIYIRSLGRLGARDDLLKAREIIELLERQLEKRKSDGISLIDADILEPPRFDET